MFNHSRYSRRVLANADAAFCHLGLPALPGMGESLSVELSSSGLSAPPMVYFAGAPLATRPFSFPVLSPLFLTILFIARALLSPRRFSFPVLPLPPLLPPNIPLRSLVPHVDRLSERLRLVSLPLPARPCPRWSPDDASNDDEGEGE